MVIFCFPAPPMSLYISAMRSNAEPYVIPVPATTNIPDVRWRKGVQ